VAVQGSRPARQPAVRTLRGLQELRHKEHGTVIDAKARSRHVAEEKARRAERKRIGTIGTRTRSSQATKAPQPRSRLRALRPPQSCPTSLVSTHQSPQPAPGSRGYQQQATDVESVRGPKLSGREEHECNDKQADGDVESEDPLPGEPQRGHRPITPGQNEGSPVTLRKIPGLSLAALREGRPLTAARRSGTDGGASAQDAEGTPSLDGMPLSKQLDLGLLPSGMRNRQGDTMRER